MSEPIATHETSDTRNLKASEAAERLGISKRSVYRLIENNELPHVWITEHIVRIPADELEAWIEERRSA